MVNRPKRDGTAAETAVVRLALDSGFPDADRIPPSGALDRGDVLLHYAASAGSRGLRIIAEVKSTRRTVQVKPWIGELLAECGNWRDGATTDTMGLLAVKYPGVGDRSMHRWFAAMPQEWWRIRCPGWDLVSLPFWGHGNRVSRFVDEVLDVDAVRTSVHSSPVTLHRFRSTDDRWLVAGSLVEMLTAMQHVNR